jgi:hypothetical protein
MSKILIGILIVSIAGNLVGLFATYKFLKARRQIAGVRENLDNAQASIEHLTALLDKMYSTRMVFLHHSVGKGILEEGGLRDSLFDIGVSIKSATYGDDIGQDTDMRHWLPKFRDGMNRILRFKAHPNTYYSNDITNDIVMFKSCYPNSDISSEGTEPGNPTGKERSVADFKAAFEDLKPEFAKRKDKLFIYMTAPPLVPEETSPENARRAREFNNWLIGEYLPAYVSETGCNNLVVFDLFGFLAGEDNYLKQEYRRAHKGDSHPNVTANREAAAKFMQFFHQVWQSRRGKSAAE